MSFGKYELLLGLLDGLLGSFLLFLGGILGETARLAFFLGIEAEVLQKEGLTGLQGRGLRIGLLAILGKLHGNAQALGHVVHDVLQGELRIHLLGTSEVGHDDQGTTFLEDLLEGRHGPADAGVVGDVEVLVQGDVEVDSHDGLLAGEVVAVDVLLHICLFCYKFLRVCKFSYLCIKIKGHDHRIPCGLLEGL